MLDNFACFLLLSADFFQNLLLQNSFWNTIRVLNCLDPDQDQCSVCIDYQQTTKVTTSKERVVPYKIKLLLRLLLSLILIQISLEHNTKFDLIGHCMKSSFKILYPHLKTVNPDKQTYQDPHFFMHMKN